MNRINGDKEEVVQKIIKQIDSFGSNFSEMIRCLVDAVHDKEKEAKHPITKIYKEILKTQEITHIQILEILTEKFQVLPEMLFEAVYSLSDADILNKIFTFFLYQRGFVFQIFYNNKEKNTSVQKTFEFTHPYNIPQVIAHLEKVQDFISLVKSRKGTAELAWSLNQTQSGKREVDYLSDYIASEFNKYEHETEKMIQEIFGGYNFSNLGSHKVEFLMDAMNHKGDLLGEFRYDFDLSLSPFEMHRCLELAVKKKRQFEEKYMKVGGVEFPLKIIPLTGNH